MYSIPGEGGSGTYIGLSVERNILLETSRFNLNKPDKLMVGTAKLIFEPILPPQNIDSDAQSKHSSKKTD